MRQSLLFGGLESIQYNANRKNQNLRLFEFGNTYQHYSDKANAENPILAYKEEYHLGLWISGKRVSGSWAHVDEDSSFYELKSYVENIFARVGLSNGSVVTTQCDNDIFSKGLTVLSRSGVRIAEMGIVSAAITKNSGIDMPVYYADINWTALMNVIRKNKVLFKEISKYPSVSRDLALLIDKNIEFEQIEKIALQAERKILKNIELFDVYEGKNLPAGKKSYAVNFVLQDENKTLTDKQIDAVMNKIIAGLKKNLSAELR